MPARFKPNLSAPAEVLQFGEHLRLLVVSTGMSVADLAEAALVPRSSLYAVLACRRVPSSGFMGLLALALREHSALPVGECYDKIEDLIRLHYKVRSSLSKPKPPSPPVHVDVLPEQINLAIAFQAFLGNLAQQGFVLGELPSVSPSWIRRYADGNCIPSWDALFAIGHTLEERGINVWPSVHRLDDLATAARAARAAERRWARLLTGGSP